MRMPAMQGLIERRILVNYRVDAEVAARLLPPSFEPQIVNGYAVGGICLIRLRNVRPRFWPARLGFASENAAHRFAVEWTDLGRTRRGVYVPRRDTSSRLNTLAGGRLFPGVHHHAHFRVRESSTRLHVVLASDDGQTQVEVDAAVTARPLDSVLFASLADASEFFRQGSCGFSPCIRAGVYEGLELKCDSWNIRDLAVRKVRSSFFDDPRRFPPGSVQFDCALVMYDLPHQWVGLGTMKAPRSSVGARTPCAV